MADWNKLKIEYIQGGISYRQLACKHGVGLSAIKSRASQEGWTGLRAQAREITDRKTVDAVSERNVRVSGKLYDAADKLLDKLMEALDRVEAEDILADKKGFRSLTGALNDLKAIKDIRSEADLREQEARIARLRREAQKEEAGSDGVEVILSGETEAYSQ